VSSTKTQIAAGAMLLALGGVAGAAVNGQSSTPKAASAVVRPAPVEVRTQVVRRTIHITRHAKPRPARKPKAAVLAAPPRAAAAAPPPAYSTPVSAPRAVPIAATRTATKPLRTSTSGSSGRTGGEREREHEGGGDD